MCQARSPLSFQKKYFAQLINTVQKKVRGEPIAIGSGQKKCMCCPDTKLCGFAAVYPVANGKDGIQYLKFCIVAFSVSGSCPEIPDNWIFVQLICFKNIFQVFAHCSYIYTKQFSHAFLTKLKCFAFKYHFHLYFLVSFHSSSHSNSFRILYFIS